MRRSKLMLLAVAIMAGGCTTTSTQLAMEDYRVSESQKQLAVDNTYNTANQQMLLNLAQRLRALGVKEEAIAAVQKTWVARNALEDMRLQYAYARMLSMVTVGPFIYDQVGFVNAMSGDAANSLKKFSNAVEAGDKAAGVNGPSELLPNGGAPSTADILKKLQKSP